MAVPASDIDANIVGSTGRPTWTPSGGLAYFDGSTGDADSTFGFPLDRLHLITAGADGSSPATVDAGGSPASSLIGGGLPTLISDRAAFVCVDDMSSYSSQNKICVTKNNAAIESFTVAHGTVLNLEYVVGE